MNGYELGSGKGQSWYASRRTAWGELPDTLASQLQLAPESQLMIVCYFAEQRKHSGERTQGHSLAVNDMAAV